MGLRALVSNDDCRYLRKGHELMNAFHSILWAAVFGVFGKLYIHENPEGDSGVTRMKNAVWIDLINMLLWFITAVFAALWFFFLRGGRSLHTGRAAV